MKAFDTRLLGRLLLSRDLDRFSPRMVPFLFDIIRVSARAVTARCLKLRAARHSASRAPLRAAALQQNLSQLRCSTLDIICALSFTGVSRTWFAAFTPLCRLPRASASRVAPPGLFPLLWRAGSACFFLESQHSIDTFLSVLHSSSMFSLTYLVFARNGGHIMLR